MKTFRIFLAFAFLFVSLNMSAQESGKQTISIKTNIYCDHCKQCESCGPRIYNQLMDVPGIRKVKIDDETSTINVTYNTSKPYAMRSMTQVLTRTISWLQQNPWLSWMHAVRNKQCLLKFISFTQYSRLFIVILG